MWREWFRRPKGPSPEMQAIVVEVRELAATIREDTRRKCEGPRPQKREKVG